ncbi:MAG TPA: 3'-5' exonuclease, partial [Burkholderiaceae bacterium]|nr:3'-5' exonuclease [Burkholderiaceae bacterium]
FESISSLLRGMSQRELTLEQMKRKRTGIRLSTIEAAKGLEFDHVIMPDVNAGEFSGRHADDKNLFYVGASRTKHLLTLTSKTGRASSYLHAIR